MITVIRLALTALLIYVAVYGESKHAMALLLVLIAIVNELQSFVITRTRKRLLDHMNHQSSNDMP